MRWRWMDTKLEPALSSPSGKSCFGLPGGGSGGVGGPSSVVLLHGTGHGHARRRPRICDTFVAYNYILALGNLSSGIFVCYKVLPCSTPAILFSLCQEST